MVFYITILRLNSKKFHKILFFILPLFFALNLHTQDGAAKTPAPPKCACIGHFRRLTILNQPFFLSKISENNDLQLKKNLKNN